RERGPGHAGRAATDGQRPAAEPAGAGQVARLRAAPADGPRAGESNLAAVLRPGSCADRRGLRHPRRSTDTPRVARLPPPGVGRWRLGPEEGPQTDRARGDLRRGGDRAEGEAGAGPGESAVVSRSADAPDGRNGP